MEIKKARTNKTQCDRSTSTRKTIYIFFFFSANCTPCIRGFPRRSSKESRTPHGPDLHYVLFEHNLRAYLALIRSNLHDLYCRCRYELAIWNVGLSIMPQTCLGAPPGHTLTGSVVFEVIELLIYFEGGFRRRERWSCCSNTRTSRTCNTLRKTPRELTVINRRQSPGCEIRKTLYLTVTRTTHNRHDQHRVQQITAARGIWVTSGCIHTDITTTGFKLRNH